MGNAPNSVPRPRGNDAAVTNHNQSDFDTEVLCEKLWKDGYVVLKNAVDKYEVDNALRAINRSMGKHPPIREEVQL